MRSSHGLVLALVACVAACGIAQGYAARDTHRFAAAAEPTANAGGELADVVDAAVLSSDTPAAEVEELVSSKPAPADGERVTRDVRSVTGDAEAASTASTAATGGSNGPHAFQLQPLWPQPFHSTRNAGQSIVHGPLGPGSCSTDMIPNSINQATYYHTGVLSLDNQRLYVGRCGAVCVCVLGTCVLGTCVHTRVCVCRRRHVRATHVAPTPPLPLRAVVHSHSHLLAACAPQLSQRLLHRQHHEPEPGVGGPGRRQPHPRHRGQPCGGQVRA